MTRIREEEEEGTDPDCERAMTDGVAVMGDCDTSLKSGIGRVTSNGSTPGLMGRILADPNTLRNVTSESVESSCIIASVLDHWVLETIPKVLKALAASSSLRSELNLAIAVAEVSDDRILVAGPSVEVRLDQISAA